VITLHDRPDGAMPEKMPASRKLHYNCRSIFRDSRGQRHVSLKFRFLVEKNHGN
jgi:hypothetical protein